MTQRHSSPASNAFRLTLLLVLASIALPGCQRNTATGRYQLLTMGKSQEIALGEQALPELVQQYGGEVQSEPVRAYVNRVGRRLLAQVEPEYRDLPWQFTVLDSDVINAFALPGGKVFISMGLLRRFTNESQVAGVLGHEIGHVTAKHVGERITRAAVVEYGAAAVGGGESLVTQGVQMFGKGYLLKFGRDQEAESDILGMRYMVEAGYDPIGMFEVLAVLREASSGNKQPEFLSTHPHPETRQSTVEDLLGDDYRYTQGNKDFGKFKGRFDRDLAPYLGQ